MTHQQTPMYMKDWMERLDSIIQMNGRELLNHAGKVSHQMALDKSSKEYSKYRDEARMVEHEQSLVELEEDIKKLKPSNDKGNV